MGKFIDLTGKKFGRWTVLKRVENSKNWHAKFLCRCDCGVEKVLLSHSLIEKTTLSCGCLRDELAKKQMTTHGKSNTKLHGIWLGMLGRCYNHRNIRYSNYGGRGITICDEWQGENGFKNFYKWAMENGYKEDLTIDRIDVNGNYEPSNCKWSTNLEQQRNKTNNHFVTINNETHCISEWAEKLNMPRHQFIIKYINRGG